MPGADPAPVAGEWLRFAREDLAGAEADLSDRDDHVPRHVCFAAQQAAEKALKAMLVARQVQYPFHHDLEQLANLLAPEEAAELAVEELPELTQWAVASRYPGADEPEWTDAERAVQTARRIVAAAIAEIEEDAE